MRFSFSLSRFTRLNFLFIGWVFLITTLLFLFGRNLTTINSLLILVFSAVASNFCIGFKKNAIFLNLVSIIIISFLIFLSQFYIDLTFDGQAYHQEMMIQMSNGWNPVYELIDKMNNQSLWVNHYSKGYEVIGAVFYSFLDSITSFKFINTLFLGLSFLYPFLYFRKKNKKNKAILIALIIALNPVVLIQIMTNLIDGFLYCVTIITIFSYLLSRTKKIYVIDFILGFLLLLNIKFTGVVFGIVLYGVILIYKLFIDKESIKQVLQRTTLIIIIAIPFLFSPYINNYLEKGHPLYPLMGINKVDFVDDYLPDVLKDRGKLEKLVFTNFVSIGNRGDSKLKIPFTFSLNELQKMRNGAPRVGSFGVWWGGILLVSFLYYFMSIYRIRDKFKLSIYEVIIGVMLLLLLLNKAGWWLRYTPYIWTTPLLLFLSVDRFKKQKIEFKLLFSLVLVNAALTLVVSLGLGYKYSKLFKEQLFCLKDIKTPIEVDFDAYLGNKALFKEFKIPFKEGSKKTFKVPKIFNNIVVIESKLKVNE